MGISYEQFVEQAEALIEQFEVLIEQMPEKGLIEEDCQRLCLQNRLNELSYTVNGTTAEDFEPLEAADDE